MATSPSLFIAEYSEEMYPCIAFSWNGKHSREFEDANQDFRWLVVQECLAVPGTASRLLLEHLFTADAHWSEEAWGAPNHFALLAAALLTEGQEQSLAVFTNGFVTSFDTFCACHEIQLSPDLVARLAFATHERLAGVTTNDERKPLEGVAELFQKLQQGNATQGLAQVASGTPVSNLRVALPRWYHRPWKKLSSLLGLRKTTRHANH